MKTLLILVMVSLAIPAHAGYAEKLRGIIRAFTEGRPMIREVDVIHKVRQSQHIAIAGKTENVEIVEVPFKELGHPSAYFKATAQSDVRFAKGPIQNRVVNITLEINEIDSKTKLKLKQMLGRNDSDIIGHYDAPRLTAFTESPDYIRVNLRFEGIDALNLNHARGLTKVVDEALRIAIKGKVDSVVKNNRHSAYAIQQAAAGAR